VAKRSAQGLMSTAKLSARDSSGLPEPVHAWCIFLRSASQTDQLRGTRRRPYHPRARGAGPSLRKKAICPGGRRHLLAQVLEVLVDQVLQEGAFDEMSSRTAAQRTNRTMKAAHFDIVEQQGARNQDSAAPTFALPFCLFNPNAEPASRRRGRCEIGLQAKILSRRSASRSQLPFNLNCLCLLNRAARVSSNADRATSLVTERGSMQLGPVLEVPWLREQRAHR
jgi:hypothetical protein